MSFRLFLINTMLLNVIYESDATEWLIADVYYPEGPIPKKLHLIWVGDMVRPDYVAAHVSLWTALMPEWDIRLWTNADVSRFPDIVQKCTKGAQQADIMRLFILYKEGGVYVDTDIVPHRSLSPYFLWGLLCSVTISPLRGRTLSTHSSRQHRCIQQLLMHAT